MGISQSYTLDHLLCKAQTPGGPQNNDRSLSRAWKGGQTKVSSKEKGRHNKRKFYTGVESCLKEESSLESDIGRLYNCVNNSPTSESDDSISNQQGSFEMTAQFCKKTKGSDQPMDDYIEPKDSKKFILRSPLSANYYSDDDDDDEGYSKPYNQVPGPGGSPMWKEMTSTVPDPEDIYEISPDKPMKTKTLFDYDVPPSRKSNPTIDHTVPVSPHKPKTSSLYPDLDPEPGDYSRLKYNGTSAAKPTHRKSVSDDNQLSDSEDSYSHTSSWVVQKTEHQTSTTSNPPLSPNRPVLGVPAAMKTASRQNSNGSLSGTSPVLKNTGVNSPAVEGSKTFTRQRVIYPRKSSSGVTDSEAQQNSSPAIYEEAWDTPQQQKKLEENLRLARSISTCSDTFEDALEYLPDDWAPARPRSGQRKTDNGRGGGAKTVDPVTGGDYEPAWDLNRGLEKKLRDLQATHAGSDSGGGGGGEGNYQEPWDLGQKKRELEERVKRARAEGGRGNTRSPQPQQQQQHQFAPAGGGELYEAPWDTRKGLAHMLQSSHSVEGQRSSTGLGVASASTRSSQSVSSTIGEPINAMIPLNNQEWYHGNISRDDAERMLRVCKDGSYLVRDSSDRCHYTLSIKSAVQTIHIQIDQCQKADGSMRYILGKNSKAFYTIPSMIDHYAHHIVPIKGANHMTLLYPVHCKYSGGEESHV